MGFFNLIFLGAMARSHILKELRFFIMFIFQLKEYSVFPGQVIQSTVTNPTGSKLVAHSLTCDATPKLAAFTTKLRQNDTIQVVMASGPFTTNDSLAYEPFRVSNLIL